MKAIGFDTGPLISLVTNNLLWILEPLKEHFGGEFFITPAVRREIIDRPFETKRFELEAFQISQLLRNRVVSVETNEKIIQTRKKLMDLANHSYKARGQWLRIVSDAEIEMLAADAVLDAEATVIDERTARLLLENPYILRDLLKNKLHCNVLINKNNIEDFRKILKDVQIIRSTELVTVAYKLGLLDSYLVEKSEIVKEPRKKLLDAALWAVKIRGCSISSKEIESIIKSECKP